MKIDCSAGPPFSPAKISDAQERALVADEGAQNGEEIFSWNFERQNLHYLQPKRKSGLLPQHYEPRAWNVAARIKN
jgi:hypothetical protein